jgi:glycosyltransferase involved in cell wall biosynthesis
MLDGMTVAVVVPAYDEEELLPETLAGIPEFVDRIYVVDDASRDGTAEAAESEKRVQLIRHAKNLGVGAAIVSGYQQAIADHVDVTCVMAADNQMAPEDLEPIARPVVQGEADYAKANRLVSGEAWQLIPHARYLGNAMLSLLTKIASGYWHVADSQSGFTAVSLGTLQRLDLDRIYPRYGFPNDMLVHLNVIDARVRDVPSRPVYNVGEQSGIRYSRVIPAISWLLLKAFFWRMWQKYVIRDFHPLVFFYVFGIAMFLAGLALGIAEVVLRILGNEIPPATVVLVALLLLFGSQFTLFAMWFDLERNKELR